MNTPDNWVILKITDGDQTIHKLLSGWYGGYLEGDSYRLNSGITDIVENENSYDISGYSGSVYRCFKNSQNMSLYMNSVYHGMKKKIENTEIDIETIDIKEIL